MMKRGDSCMSMSKNDFVRSAQGAGGSCGAGMCPMTPNGPMCSPPGVGRTCHMTPNGPVCCHMTPNGPVCSTPGAGGSCYQTPNGLVCPTPRNGSGY